jgi:hypothetical protein
MAMFWEPNFKNRDMKEAIEKSVLFPVLVAWLRQATAGAWAEDAAA